MVLYDWSEGNVGRCIDLSSQCRSFGHKLCGEILSATFLSGAICVPLTRSAQGGSIFVLSFILASDVR